MNITKTEALVLQQLASVAGSQLYGLEMVKASDGALKMGSIYVILDRLHRKGFVESQREELPVDAQRPPRRLYKISGTGTRILHAYEALQMAFAVDPQGV